MKLVLIGMNHKTAPVELRECLAPEPEDLPIQVRRTVELDGVREALMIATCNRVEIMAACDEGQEDPADLLCNWLLKDAAFDPQKARQGIYIHQDQDAVRHLFRVASSLDSMVVGEPQILGQIKEAYRLAAQAGTTKAILNKLLHKTFQVAKRVRTETSIGGAAVSVSYAAVELAKKIFDDLSGLSALLIGAGEMAELAAEHLLSNGVSKVLVANRTLERAVELAERFGGGSGSAFGLDEMEDALSQADIVISSTGANRAVIGESQARGALKRRRGKPLFFIDIAVPRDIDPKVDNIDGCFVYDMDDLSQVVEANRANRAQAAKSAERIVAEEVVKFSRWMASLDVVPTIAELNQRAEELRQAEMARTMKGLGDLSPEQAEAMDRLTKSLVKKILHGPILFLKDQTHGKSQDTKRGQLAMVRRAFGLGENGKPEKS